MAAICARSSADRAIDYGSIGRGFKSLRAHTINADQRHYLWILPHKNPTIAREKPTFLALILTSLHRQGLIREKHFLRPEAAVEFNAVRGAYRRAATLSP
jgi:hypothetical protein